MPRWGQQSADAATRPESLLQRAIEPALVRAGITVPDGKSAENATGVQKPVVSADMVELSQHYQRFVCFKATAWIGRFVADGSTFA